MTEKYFQSALLAISAVKLAELINWIPEPTSFAKAVILALVTGFMGGMGRWLADYVKRKIKNS